MIRIDPYTNIAYQSIERQHALAQSLQQRGMDPELIGLYKDALTQLEHLTNGTILDVGCGTGEITKVIYETLKPNYLFAIDPSEVFIQYAKRFELSNLLFSAGTIRNVPKSTKFDLIFFNTVFAHIPDNEELIKQAINLLNPNGKIIVFDGDYEKRSIAIHPFDPLQVFIKVMIDSNSSNAKGLDLLPDTFAKYCFRKAKEIVLDYTAIDQTYITNYLKRGIDLLHKQEIFTLEFSEACISEWNNRLKNKSFKVSFPFTFSIYEENDKI